ncbi:OmpA family protein [bacterium]|nr:OmpA family protein [bacterium]
MARPKPEETEENIFWVTMTDLMMGLMMVFIVLFIQSVLSASSDAIATSQAKQEVVQELQEVMRANDIDVEIEDDGSVKISDLELFKVNSAELSPKGKAYLDKFIPMYFNLIYSNDVLSQNIENIVIQGHTDSQTFKNARTQNEQCLLNMDLSMRRAYTVSQYALNTKFDQKYAEKIRKSLIVEGRGSGNPILVNGKEDLNKSRRVELVLSLKKASEVSGFLQLFKNQ